MVARTGARGWINKDFVAVDPPDLGSRLHHITEENLTTILENEYVDKGLWKLATGNDYTTLAAAVVVGNSGRKGVAVDWDAAAKYKKDHPWKGWLDPWMIDNFAIYHGSTVLAGHNIWLPSPTYVRMLQSSGVIGSRPGWVNAAVDVGKGIAGFVAGVVSGVLGSLWDTLTGLWDLAKGIVDAVRSALDGSLFASISDIYDTVSGMTHGGRQATGHGDRHDGPERVRRLRAQWNHPDTYRQWHFKGSIIGAIALEVILAIFTGGGTFAAKVLAKIGKYFPKLMRVLDKLLDLAKKLPGRRDRDRPGDGDHRRDRDRDDEDLSNADRSWEQARALAALVTEEHDRLDTPVTTLIPMLDATVAAKFSGVSGYQAILTGQPDTYKIVLQARRREVDDHYTGKNEPTAPRFEFFRTLYGKIRRPGLGSGRQGGLDTQRAAALRPRLPERDLQRRRRGVRSGDAGDPHLRRPPGRGLVVRRLDVSPVEHFAATDYAGSEVLIYRWDADAGRVLVCCNDLSEKIADWAYGAGRPAYATRYRVFSFLGVGDYRRSGVRDAWRRLQDDFLITRTDRRIPLDDITVAARDEGLAVTISFELGFGAVTFDCRRVMISEPTTRAVPGSGAAPRDVVDGDGETSFDEDEFLSGLYASGPTGS